MNHNNVQGNVERSANAIRRFPLQRLYFLLVVILTTLSVFGLKLETDNIFSDSWKFSAEFKVNSTTLTLLLLVWVPLLIPWIVKLFPHFQQFIARLRESGIEEIEAGIARVKFFTDSKVVKEYQASVLEPSLSDAAPEKITQQIERFYESIRSTTGPKRLDSSEALAKIDQLASYYDRVREVLPSGKPRTRLMNEIAAIMWSLMSDVHEFPLRKRLNSAKGGERLSAYKYIESRPSSDCLELLLSRAIGGLEMPHGQAHALVALRRVVMDSPLSTDQLKLILHTLEWNARLDFLGTDRRSTMEGIIKIISQKTDRGTAS